MHSEPTNKRSSDSCRRRPLATPIPPPCSKRSAVAGGTASIRQQRQPIRAGLAGTTNLRQAGDARTKSEQAESSEMIKRMVIMLTLVGLVLGGFFWFQNFKSTMIKKFMAAAASPPQTVSTTVATTQDWQPQMEAVGSLRAGNGADLGFGVRGN